MCERGSPRALCGPQVTRAIGLKSAPEVFALNTARLAYVHARARAAAAAHGCIKSSYRAREQNHVK